MMVMREEHQWGQYVLKAGNEITVYMYVGKSGRAGFFAIPRAPPAHGCDVSTISLCHVTPAKDENDHPHIKWIALDENSEYDMARMARMMYPRCPSIAYDNGRAML